MNNRHDRIRDLLIAAMELPAEKRGAYLDHACARDAELRAELQRLIEADGSTQSFLMHAPDGAIPRFPAGAVLAERFRVVRFIAAGGMGDVYEVDDSALNERLAMKTIRPELVGNENTLERFKREIQYAKRVTHPNVCRIHDLGVHRGGGTEVVFLTMELLTGETLANRLRRTGRMSTAEALPLVVQMAGALGAAHKSGIVHRDFKTSNLMLVGPKAVITDFGLARPSVSSKDGSLTEAGKMVGTPAYMAPEQVTHGKITPATDIYAFGLVMYEMLTGHRPFEGDTPQLQRLSEPPAPPDRYAPDLDRRWTAVILRCLERDPLQRYQDTEQIVRALTDSRPARKLARPRWLVAALSVVTMFFLAFLAWRMWSPVAKPSPDALRWYQEGLNALRDGTYYKASKSLERAVALAPRYAMAHAHLAEAWLELDLTDKARDEMLRAIPPGTRPSLATEDESYLDAVHLTLTGDYPGAIEKYKEIQKQTPTPDAYVDLGRAYEKSEDIKDALASYQEAAKRGPQFAAAFLRSGVLYARSQNAAAATAAFDQAETLYRALNNIEGITEVIYQRALATTSAHPQEAKALAEQAIATAHAAGNTNQEVLAMLTLATAEIRMGDSADAQKTALQAVDTARKEGLENLTPRGLMQLGTAYQVKGDPEQAAKYFEESIDNARRYKSVRNEMRASLSLASALVQQDKIDECLKVLGPALQFYQKGGYREYTSQASQILIRAKTAQGDYAGALQAAQDQLQVPELSNRQMSFAEQAVGKALSELNRFPEAAAHYQQALALAQTMGDKAGIGYAQKNIATQFARLGRYQEAAELLQRAGTFANETGGDRALGEQVHLLLAQMAVSRLEFEEANRQAKQVLAGPPDDGYALQARAVLAVSAALSGKKKDAIQQADRALQLSQRVPRSQAEAWLVSAVVRLEAGASKAALDAAARAQKDFAQHGQIEWEWRAWAVSAIAAKAAGDRALAKENSAAADTALAALAGSWPAEDYQSYLNRPDIRRYRKQLGHI